MPICKMDSTICLKSINRVQRHDNVNATKNKLNVKMQKPRIALLTVYKLSVLSKNNKHIIKTTTLCRKKYIFLVIAWYIKTVFSIGICLIKPEQEIKESEVSTIVWLI